MSAETILQLCWPAAESNPESWQVWHQGDVRLLQDVLTAESRYQLILPAQWLLFEHIQLPAKSQRQAMQALPFMVEEQLACDLDCVHIAVGRRQASGAWPVLVIKTQLLNDILSLFNRAGCLLTAIYADAQLLELGGKQLHLHLDSSRVLVAGLGLASAFTTAEAQVLLPLLLEELTPDKVLISGEAADEQQQLLLAQWQTEFEAQGAQVEREAALRPTVNLQSINVLQGAYAAKVARPGRSWALAACALLIAAWLAQWGFQLGSGFHWNTRGGQYMALAEQVYRGLFPQATSAADPKRRVESFLLSQQGVTVGSQSFSQMFGQTMTVYQTLPDHKQITINQLRFDAKRGQLEFELAAQSISQLDNFKQALGKAGIQSRMGSASDSEQGIIGRIQITGVQ